MWIACNCTSTRAWQNRSLEREFRERLEKRTGRAKRGDLTVTSNISNQTIIAEKDFARDFKLRNGDWGSEGGREF